MTRRKTEKEYIVEYIGMGNSVKVTAIDPVTLAEVSVITPANMSKKEAGELAVRKLEYMMKKRSYPHETD